MSKRFLAGILATLILAVAPVSALASTSATAKSPAVNLNGQAITDTAMHNGHIYIPADAFAAAVGGSFTTDAKGVSTIQAGPVIPSLEELKQLNPKLAVYEALSPYIPSMGIHMGVKGPGLVLAVSSEGTVNAVELMVPSTDGWFAWFDQPENAPMEMPGMGSMYTQHVYLTNPQGLLPENAGEPVILNGRYLATGYDVKPYKQGGKTYIPLRTAVEMLDGQITWDQAAFTATAKVAYKGITYDWLTRMNPAMTKYMALSEFVPNMGVHHGAHGPHVTAMTDSKGFVTGFELAIPSAAGWAPWFDQPEGMPDDLPGLGKVYTQHIYFVDPATIQ